MLFPIIKKQLFMLMRNPVEILLLIGLPIILIVILGNALSSWMNGETPAITGKIAILEREDEGRQLEQFLEDMKKMGLPEETIQYFEQEIDTIAPIRLLKENVFGSEELQDMFQIEEVNLSDKEKILNDDGYTMLLEVPENFTYDTLRTMVLGEKREAELIIYENDQQQIAAGILKNVLGQFQEKLTKETFLQQNQLDSGLVLANNENLANEIIPIEEKNPINAKKYYTVGMATMNVLFIASVIGSFAFLEKKTQVFDRIILANVSRWLYFVGILISSALFAFLQLLIIYGFSWIVFDVAFPDAYAFFMMTGIYALAVGGIAVLLTAISYRLESETLTNFFSGVIVTIMAFIGGSFFPIGDSSEIIQQLGNYTPNGASMSAYLALLRGDGFAEIADHLTFLVLFAFASTVMAAMTFPKRGISS